MNNLTFGNLLVTISRLFVFDRACVMGKLQAASFRLALLNGLETESMVRELFISTGVAERFGDGVYSKRIVVEKKIIGVK